MDKALGDFVLGYWVGFISAVIVCFSCAIAWWTPNSYWRGEAIERGHAVYCPNNGNFAWIGECDGE